MKEWICEQIKILNEMIKKCEGKDEELTTYLQQAKQRLALAAGRAYMIEAVGEW